jgi:hypothetical protein
MTTPWVSRLLAAIIQWQTALLPLDVPARYETLPTQPPFH